MATVMVGITVMAITAIIMVIIITVMAIITITAIITTVIITSDRSTSAEAAGRRCGPTSDRVASTSAVAICKLTAIARRPQPKAGAFSLLQRSP
ncbi:hypothetical protein JQ597_19225 [Bradyrhizobium sp. AUGA SZCCT0177]|uniref:hypothetical protein n=1 Tax=Bradyrhizobium sp. AUGA SZCCT0177 TaxID=2807665 RepID=UPI001BAAD11E|nr:hypothetical protein [Bradyrhizobium sp. AUGA SZCCT0177]MBR1284184.1 hypothetical protein [Bradyrhizobium sp. AUGA SZCCT0177]